MSYNNAILFCRRPISKQKRLRVRSAISGVLEIFCHGATLRQGIYVLLYTLHEPRSGMSGAFQNDKRNQLISILLSCVQMYPCDSYTAQKLGRGNAICCQVYFRNRSECFRHFNRSSNMRAFFFYRCSRLGAYAYDEDEEQEEELFRLCRQNSKKQERILRDL